MVAGKKIHCVICNKKCSGNVLRYQDQYYHKQCFELEQSQGGGGNKPQQQQQHIRHEEAALSADKPTSRLAGAGIDSPDAAAQGEQSSANYNVNNRRSASQILTSNSNNNNNNQDDPYNHSKPHHSLRQSQQLAGAASYSHMPAVAARPPQRSGATSEGQPPPAATSTSHNQQKYHYQQQHQMKSQTIDARGQHSTGGGGGQAPPRAATLPHSTSAPANGFLSAAPPPAARQAHINTLTNCAGCGDKIKDGQALIALDLQWHVWCFKCSQCKVALHGEYVAKEGKAYCEKDYQKLFGVTCVYCKRYITGKVLQAGEAHHFHPSCARCSKCGDPFVPGEEMYLQGEVTWHPRCGPGPDPAAGPIDELALDSSSRSQLRASRGHSPSLSSRSQSRSASPFSFMSRQYGRSSPGYADSEAVGDLSRVYTISYLNADPTQGYLRRPIEPSAPKSPQFSRPTSVTRGDRSRSSSRSHLASNHQYHGGSSHLSRERSVPRGMYSVLSSMSRSTGGRARSPSMMNEEAIHLAAYPSGRKPSPDTVPKIERDDFPAPPFPYTKKQQQQQQQHSKTAAVSSAGSQVGGREPQVDKQQQQPQQRSSRPKSREIVIPDDSDGLSSSDNDDPQLKKEEEELSKIANGIGKIFLQTLKEREKLRAWKRANLDPRNASRTPSATRELPARLRYDNPTNASPSRDMDRPRPWDEEDGGGGGGPAVVGEHSPTRTRSSLGRQSQMSPSTYGYKVVQSNRSTPKPGYGLTSGPYEHNGGAGSAMTAPPVGAHHYHHLQQQQQQHHHHQPQSQHDLSFGQQQLNAQTRSSDLLARAAASTLQSELVAPAKRSFGSPHLRRSMPNVNSSMNHLLHLDGPPKLYPYHLLATSNYRLPPDVDRCHLERHLSNEEFQYIFHCDRLDFYRLPEWKRNELKRRAKLF